jgi:glycosyltransferase involved in cell wall biosynthesis
MPLNKKTGSQTAIVLAWQLSDRHAWGIVGMELYSHWALHGNYQPLMLYPIDEDAMRSIDVLRRHALKQSFEVGNPVSAQLVEKVLIEKNRNVNINIPVIHALGIEFASATSELYGSSNIGRIVFEFTALRQAKANEGRYDCYVVASEWNAQALRAVTRLPVYVNHEGVDTSIFRPGPKSGLFDPNDFLIYTSGKIEYRKGQDLVIEAFRRFSQNKDNVYLVTAWQSVFSHFSKGFQGILKHPISFNADNSVNVTKWAADNGVEPQKIIDLGQVPHHNVPYVMREMDCALQLSRAEGGTNLVAMEAMACGIPTILTNATGHRDIIHLPNAIPVSVTGKICDTGDNGGDGWGEASIDEVVHQLERLYELKRSGHSSSVSEPFYRSWSDHAVELEKIVETHI